MSDVTWEWISRRQDELAVVALAVNLVATAIGVFTGDWFLVVWALVWVVVGLRGLTLRPPYWARREGVRS